MDQHRRNILKAGATAAVGGLIASTQGCAQTGALAQGAPSVPPLASTVGMRLATGSIGASGKPGIIVVLDGGRAIDLGEQARRQNASLAFDPASMLSLIASGDVGLNQARQVAERAARDNAGTIALDSVRLASPIPRPDRNIYCVGWNYLDHFEEGKNVRADKTVDKLPDHPVFFTKGTHTMNGPFDAIPIDPTLTKMTDWEAELAVVIGRKGINIPEAQAMDYVFGYAAYNDTTARDIQQKVHGGQWFRGKSLDGHGPMGPWIVTAAGVKLDDVRVISRVNGVEKQNASYKQMYFKIPRIIAELSRGLTLEPGDIIATGTPSGVGFARKPQEFLKHGDVMETEIVGVGIIRNPIRSVA